MSDPDRRSHACPDETEGRGSAKPGSASPGADPVGAQLRERTTWVRRLRVTWCRRPKDPAYFFSRNARRLIYPLAPDVPSVGRSRPGRHRRIPPAAAARAQTDPRDPHPAAVVSHWRQRPGEDPVPVDSPGAPRAKPLHPATTSTRGPCSQGGKRSRGRRQVAVVVAHRPPLPHREQPSVSGFGDEEGALEGPSATLPGISAPGGGDQGRGRPRPPIEIITA